MYFDSRLWGFTRGVRLRIFGAVAVGVLAVLFGIARLGLLGWLIIQVFDGAPVQDLVLPFIGVGVVMVVRGWLEYLRTMVAHNTAARVQGAPAPGGLRSGDPFGPCSFWAGAYR